MGSRIFPKGKHSAQLEHSCLWIQWIPACVLCECATVYVHACICVLSFTPPVRAVCAHCSGNELEQTPRVKQAGGEAPEEADVCYAAPRR